METKIEATEPRNRPGACTRQPLRATSAQSNNPKPRKDVHACGRYPYPHICKTPIFLIHLRVIIIQFHRSFVLFFTIPALYRFRHVEGPGFWVGSVAAALTLKFLRTPDHLQDLSPVTRLEVLQCFSKDMEPSVRTIKAAKYRVSKYRVVNDVVTVPKLCGHG
jgi:hypothetical protein